MTLVFPAWLALFKSPMRGFSLPSASSAFVKKALSRCADASAGLQWRGGVGVLVKGTLRHDVGCGWITEDRFYIWTSGGCS